MLWYRGYVGALGSFGVMYGNDGQSNGKQQGT